MNDLEKIHVPAEWHAVLEKIPGGEVMVIGGTDTGKSTFVRWLTVRLLNRFQRVGWIDCDVGQSTLGLPSTLNMSLLGPSDSAATPPDKVFFVGATSPRGHMLPMLVGAERLVQSARTAGIECLVTDTTGIVSAASGGGALKQWKIELLRPDIVVAFEHHRELDHILQPLEKSLKPTVHRLRPSPAVQFREPHMLESLRWQRYRSYFSGAVQRHIPVRNRPVFNSEKAAEGSLTALQNASGFCLSIGILSHLTERTIELIAPRTDLGTLAGIRFGNIRIDADSLREKSPAP
ncbi:MAG: Clp1/GlmU family protein [Desulfobacterales bacterium]